MACDWVETMVGEMDRYPDTMLVDQMERQTEVQTAVQQVAN
jgi:hypothetical protein